MLARVAVALAAVLALAACGSNQTASATGDVTKTYASGDRPAAPAVSEQLLGGGSFDLGAHRGHVVVLNFWESYCAPCRVEASDLESVYQTASTDGTVFVGVNVLDDQDKANAYETAHKITYPSIFDPAGRIMLAFRDVPPSAVPATIVVDPNGKIAALHVGSVTAAELTAMIKGARS